jgi:cytochrome c-type biogenesis protein CcmH/NrfG
MQSKDNMAWLTLVFALLGQAVMADDDLMSSQMVDQARQWQHKNRSDLAAELWRKLLLTAPRHPEALVKLGTIEARAGNVKEAEALYIRANQLATPPAGLKELYAVILAAKGSSEDIPQATAELRKPAAAVAKTPSHDQRPANKLVDQTLGKSRQNTAVKPTGSAIGASQGSIGAVAIDDSQLIFSTALDLVPVRPHP